MVPVLWQLYVRMALALVRIMAHWEMRVFRAKGGRIWLSLVTTRQARPRTVSGKERLPRASAGLLVAVQYQQPRQALQLRSDLEERDMTNSPGFARSRVPPIRRLGMATVAAACIVAVATVPDAAGASAPAGPANTSTADCSSLTTCYTPKQLEVAYGILPLLDHGTNGHGETVVLPELAEPQFPFPVSDIRQDLAQFDKLFNLPVAQLRAVTSLAPTASPWLANGEEVLDTEMVHAVAPGAVIVEVLVKATSSTTPPTRWPLRSRHCGWYLPWRHHLDQRRRPDRGGALRHPRRGGRPACSAQARGRPSCDGGGRLR